MPDLKSKQKPKVKIKSKIQSNVYISNSEKLTLISNLESLLSAGIPILEAISSLSVDSKGNVKKILTSLDADLREGKKVSKSFANFPNVFDAVTINLLNGAEEAGTLEQTLKDIKINYKKDMEFNDKVKGAITYPAFIMVVFFVVLLLMLVIVVPRIADVFGRLRIPLPLPTRILIATSNIFMSYTVYIFGGLALLVFGAIYFYKKHKRVFVNILLSFPLVSKLGQQIDIVRLSRSLGLLLSSGITIVEALELSKNVVSKKNFAKAVELAKDEVTAGKSLSDGLKKSGALIPRIMTIMIEGGEKSGKLEKSFQDIADHYDNEVESSLKFVSVLIEPLILVVVGVMVGGMMLAIVAPIYGLIGQLNTGKL